MDNKTASFEFHMVFGAAGYIAIGLPVGVCNLLIAASILKYRAMTDQKELVILMGLALADGINLIGFTAAGVYRLLVVLMGYQHHLLTTWECVRLPHVLLWSFSISLSNQMLVAVSVDRLLLVSLRAKYIASLGRRYARGVVGGLFGFNIGFALLAFALALTRGHTVPTHDAMCYHTLTYQSPSPVSRAFKEYSEYSSSLFPLLSVVVFACIGPMYVYQRSKVTHGSNETQQQMKLQHKLTRSMAVSCLATFLLACVPGKLAYYFWDNDMIILTRICWFLMISNPMVNVLIYHIAHKDMRTAMHGLLTCKTLPESIEMWPGRRRASHQRE